MISGIEVVLLVLWNLVVEFLDGLDAPRLDGGGQLLLVVESRVCHYGVIVAANAHHGGLVLRLHLNHTHAEHRAALVVAIGIRRLVDGDNVTVNYLLRKIIVN